LAGAGTAASASGVSGFETLTLTAADSQDMAKFLDNSTFTKLQGGFAGITAFTNVGSGITTLATTVAGNTSSIARLVDTTSNALTVSLLTAQTTAALTANDEETINLASSSTGAVTLGTLTATDLQTLNITGSGAVTITTLAANSTSTGTTLTINGSANTGGISVDASSSTIVASITGSATASNALLTGTAGADTIVGGAAADTITGGVSADTLTGNGGTDTFVFTNTATGLPSSTNFDTITDFGAASDIIQFTGIVIAALDATATAGNAAISADGIATFNIADSTLAQRMTAVATSIGGAANGEVAAFQFGSDAYVFISDIDAGLTAADVLIKLTGVSLASTSFDTVTIIGNNMTLA
jgi:Ca2+-binding RTX toxin-like protein